MKAEFTMNFNQRRTAIISFFLGCRLMRAISVLTSGTNYPLSWSVILVIAVLGIMLVLLGSKYSRKINLDFPNYKLANVAVNSGKAETIKLSNTLEAKFL